MARAHGLLSKLSGTIGKQLVFKRYGTTTVVTQYPDMDRIEPSIRQEMQRKLFAEAVVYAKSINRDPAKKAEYKKKLKKGQSVYHYALSEYLEKHKWDKV